MHNTRGLYISVPALSALDQMIDNVKPEVEKIPFIGGVVG